MDNLDEDIYISYNDYKIFGKKNNLKVDDDLLNGINNYLRKRVSINWSLEETKAILSNIEMQSSFLTVQVLYI